MSGLPLLRRAGVLAALLACTACTPDKRDAEGLAKAQGTDSRALATQPSECTAATLACARTREEHGAACLKMTEARAPEDRAKNRECALTDFAAARAQMPPDAPPDLRLRATVGLAEALVIDRDNQMDPGRRADDITKLDALAADLRGMPGGAAYAAYFSANAALSGVLTRALPEERACATLADARAALQGANAAGVESVGTTAVFDLAKHIADLGPRIDAERRPPVRSCG
jgi:hypothetical protein